MSWGEVGEGEQNCASSSGIHHQAGSSHFFMLLCLDSIVRGTRVDLLSCSGGLQSFVPVDWSDNVGINVINCVVIESI